MSSGSNFGIYGEEGSSKWSVLQVFRRPVPDEGSVCGPGAISSEPGGADVR